MTLERKTYIGLSLVLMIAISTFIFFYYQDRLSLQERLTTSLITLLLPFLVSSLTLLFRKSLFISFLIGTSVLVIGFWTSIFLYIFSKDKNESAYTLPSGYVYQHQKALVKFMEHEINSSSYRSVLIDNSYFTDSVTKRDYYIIKHIYRIGDNEVKN